MKKKMWCVKMMKVLLTTSSITIERECEKQKPKIVKKNHKVNDTATTIKKRTRF